MRILSRYSTAVSDDYHIAVAVMPTCELNNACLARADGVSPVRFEIHAGMEFRSTGERIAPITKATPNTHAGSKNCAFLILRLRLDVRLRIRLVVQILGF